MEEIHEKEKELKQIVQMAQALFERSQDLTSKSDEQSNQLAMLMNEQGKLTDSAIQNEQLAREQKERL